MPVLNGYRASIARWAVAAILFGAGIEARGADGEATETPSSSAPALVPASDLSPGWIQRNYIANTVFDDAGIKVSGYAEAGYTYNWDKPGNGPGSNGYGVVFTDKSEDARLDQLSLMVRRDPNLSADQFDLGFKAQVIYGADARFTQANGTNFYGSRYANDLNTQKIAKLKTEFFVSGGSVAIFGPHDIGPGQPLTTPGQTDPENQIDILQAALVMNLPAYNGVILTAGKFVTPWGMEHVDPTQNELYSHSYIFGLATPRTLTGVTADAPIDKDLYVMGGVVVGWDQSLEDNNSFPSFIAQTRFHASELDADHPWDFSLSGMAGPEEAGNTGDWRWTLDLTGTTHATDDMDFGFEAVLGYQGNAGTEYKNALKNHSFLVEALQPNGRSAMWYGGALYGDWKLDPDGMYVMAGRMEAFCDQDGGRGLATTVYSLTAGLDIFPFIGHELGRNLMVRPEVRWDIASKKIFDNYDSAEQLMCSIDATIKF